MTGETMFVRNTIADVLSCTVDDLDASFLDLGGDSLAAMLCISRIQREYSVELSIEDFFMLQSSTRGIAERICELRDPDEQNI